MQINKQTLNGISMDKNFPVDALLILDGWGINPDIKGNATAIADTPFLDMLESHYPCSQLLCSGEAVGLPEGVMGNSEVGHMNIGAGRKVFQSLVSIDKSIKDGSFFANKNLVSVMNRIKESGRCLHLLGLLSDGGVHSHINHVFALIDMAASRGIQNVCIHPIMDGRDTSPTSGIHFIEQLEAHLKKKRLVFIFEQGIDHKPFSPVIGFVPQKIVVNFVEHGLKGFRVNFKAD